MPTAHSNVVTLRPRAWSATAGAGTSRPAARLNSSVSMTLAGQLALARWPTPQEREDVADLRDALQRFRDLFERSPACLLVMDLAGIITRANATAAALLTGTRTELQGTSLFDLCDLQSGGELQAHLERLAAGAALDSCEIDLAVGADGPLPMSLVTLNLGDAPEGPLRSALLDVSGLRELESGLALAASVVEHTSQGVMVTDTNYRIIAVNPAFSAISGYTAGEVMGSVAPVFRTDQENPAAAEHIILGLRAHGHWQGEVWNRRKGGEAYPEWVSVNEIRNGDGAPLRYVCIVSDMTSQETAKRELLKLAHFDHLTGLPNRPNLLTRLTRALVEGARDKHLVGILYLDLDGFKDVNDAFGHNVGDRLLQFVAERLKSAVRETDVVARLAGDEFAILIPNLKSEQAAGQIADKVLQALSQTAFHEQGREIYVGASIGIALFPKDAGNPDDLLQCADQAMYVVKGAGGTGYRFHSAAAGAPAREGNQLESALREALGHQELGLRYEPQVSLRNFRILGCAARLHWERDGRGAVAPEVFIPLAEQAGLIVPYEHWALRALTAQAQQWIRPDQPSLRVSLHCSSVHLRPVHLERLLRRLAHGADPRSGVLEVIFDTAVINDCHERAAKAFAQIHRLGIRIALDRFGAGPTPLRQLQALRLSRVMLDPALVQDLETDPDAVTVVAAIIDLAHAFGLQVLAAGVASTGQLQVLRAQGCDEATGTLFSAPIPADAFTALLAQAAQTPAVESGAGPDPRAPGLLHAISGAWSRGVARLRGTASGTSAP